MIQFLTGVIGSGKTYYAINYIVKNFAKDEELKKKIDKRFQLQKVNKCITNINELKLDEFNNVYPLKFKEFYQNLKVGYQAYQDGVTDTELNELEEIKKINHSLIVLDECQNFLSKKDDVLVWWLSYARHMYMEVILITQNLSLVDAKYKSFSEFFYKAQPSSLRIFNNYMRYNQYSDSTLYNTRKTGVIKVKIISEIFFLYGSGDNVSNGSIIKKFLFLGIFFVILMIAAFLFIRSYFFSSSSDSNSSSVPASSVSNVKIDINKNESKKYYRVNSDYVLYLFRCNNKICIYNNHTYSARYIFNALQVFKDYRLLGSANYIFSFKSYYIRASKRFKTEFLDFYQGEKNEINIKDTNNSVSSFKLF